MIDVLPLVEHILTLDRGSIITHTDIENLVLIRSCTCRYYSFMKEVNRELLVYSKGINAVRGVGYRVLFGVDLIDKAVELTKQGEYKVSQAFNIIKNVDTTNLPEEYKLKVSLIYTKFNQVHKNLVGGVKELYLINKEMTKLSKVGVQNG